MRKIIRVLAPVLMFAILFCAAGITANASATVWDMVDGVVDPDMSVMTKEMALVSAVTLATYVLSAASVVLCTIIGVKTLSSKEESAIAFGGLMIAFACIGVFVGIFELVALGMAIYQTHKKTSMRLYAASLTLFVLRMTAIIASFSLIIGILAKTMS